MWEPQRLTTLWASTACYRDSFTLLLPYILGWSLYESNLIEKCSRRVKNVCWDIWTSVNAPVYILVQFTLISCGIKLWGRGKWRQNTQTQRSGIAGDCFSMRQSLASLEGRLLLWNCRGRSEAVRVLCSKLGLYDRTIKWPVGCRFYFLQLVKWRNRRLCAVFGKWWLGEDSSWFTPILSLSLTPPSLLRIPRHCVTSTFFMYLYVRCTNSCVYIRFWCDIHVE
jgi:hypothetical protein